MSERKWVRHGRSTVAFYHATCLCYLATDLCDVFILLSCRGRLKHSRNTFIGQKQQQRRPEHKTSFLFRSIARKKLFAELQRGASRKCPTHHLCDKSKTFSSPQSKSLIWSLLKFIRSGEEKLSINFNAGATSSMEFWVRKKDKSSSKYIDKRLARMHDENFHTKLSIQSLCLCLESVCVKIFEHLPQSSSVYDETFWGKRWVMAYGTWKASMTKKFRLVGETEIEESNIPRNRPWLHYELIGGLYLKALIATYQETGRLEWLKLGQQSSDTDNDGYKNISGQIRFLSTSTRCVSFRFKVFTATQSQSYSLNSQIF